MKPAFKKRKYEPQEVLRTKFSSAIQKIVGHFLETTMFNHSLTKGEEREKPIIEFLTSNLPQTYAVVKGEVVDSKNLSSPQLDVMVYDKLRSIPFFSGDNFILPAEALLASIEVKSKLNQEEIRKILRNTKKLKSLRPFGKKLDIAKGNRTIEEKVTCRYYHCIFAYETDISATNWAQAEFDRLRRVAAEENVDFTLIDRIIVLNRGLLNPVHSMAKESNNDSESFLYFYMHLLNYIQRENPRRESVPYLSYAGKLSKNWVKLKA